MAREGLDSEGLMDAFLNLDAEVVERRKDLLIERKVSVSEIVQSAVCAGLETAIIEI